MPGIFGHCPLVVVVQEDGCSRLSSCSARRRLVGHSEVRFSCLAAMTAAVDGGSRLWFCSCPLQEDTG